MSNTTKNQVLTYTKLEVVGAGFIRIGNNAGAECGGETGFVFGVSWLSSPYTGGVLPRKEAKKLADHIYKVLNKHK